VPPTQKISKDSVTTRALRILCHGTRYIVSQDRDDGISIEFDVADFDVIAKILKPHRKPRMTKEQRQAASKRMCASKLWLQTKTNSQLQRSNSHAKHLTRPQGHVDTKAGFFEG